MKHVISSERDKFRIEKLSGKQEKIIIITQDLLIFKSVDKIMEYSQYKSYR